MSTAFILEDVVFAQIFFEENENTRTLIFRDRLQTELIKRGERAGKWGPFELPVDQVDFLQAIGRSYIRVHQHTLSRSELEQLIETVRNQVGIRATPDVSVV